MFELIEKDHTDVFRLTIRIVYLLLASAIDLGVLYLVIFPGASKEEMFSDFLFGTLLLIASLVLAAPVFLYLVWKLVKRERPIFWGIALLIAALPMLMFLAVVISGL